MPDPYLEHKKRWRAKNIEKVREADRARYAKNREAISERRGKRKEDPAFHTDHNRKYKYGISAEQFEEMLARQGGVCAACGQPERGMYRGRVKALCVDHDHATGRVRSLLCGGCNLALGHTKDSPERLRMLAAYLEAHDV